MGDCPHKFSVLDDGGATRPLPVAEEGRLCIPKRERHTGRSLHLCPVGNGLCAIPILRFLFIIAHGSKIGNKKRAVDNRPYNENSPFPNVGADIIRPLGSSIQHVFDENAISGGWIVYKNMGNGADQFSVLYNR